MDYLPISKINTVVYCPRRYYIESVLGDTAVNYHLTEGLELHDKTRREGEGLWVWSDRLGIVGVIDQLREEAGALVITEFKKGYLAEHESDMTQLCAQAMCYEEMHGLKLEYGVIFYHRTRRRLRVEYSDELRSGVERAVAQMRRLAVKARFPPVIDNPAKCKGCSVKEACQPKLSRKGPPRWSGL